MVYGIDFMFCETVKIFKFLRKNNQSFDIVLMFHGTVFLSRGAVFNISMLIFYICHIYVSCRALYVDWYSLLCFLWYSFMFLNLASQG